MSADRGVSERGIVAESLNELGDDAIVLLAVLSGFTFRSVAASGGGVRQIWRGTYPDGGATGEYSTIAECARSAMMYWTVERRSPFGPRYG